MGAALSLNSTKERSLNYYVNAIAAKYILTQNFEDLLALNNEKSCNSLVILTSKIINKYLDNRSIIYLAQYTKQNNIINKLDKDKVIYLNKEKMPDLDIKSSIKKKRMCIGISKYYIKINMLYSAIATTIKPMSQVLRNKGVNINLGEEDPNKIQGQGHIGGEIPAPIDQVTAALIPLEQKATIPETEKITADIDNESLFDRRIAALSNYTYNQENKTFKANELLCKYFGTKRKPNLGDEVGINELEKLYIDEFDYLNGKFVSMSKTNREEYDKDIIQFYKAFTDNNYQLTNTSILQEIISISDIKLNNYNIEKHCGENGLYKSSFKNIRPPVANEIEKRIKLMDDHNKYSKKQLVAILANVFIVDKTITPYTITLNPKLNEDILDKLISQTRQIIINMYISCEKDFSSVLRLFNQELIDKSATPDEKKRVYVKSNDDANVVLKISEPISIAEPVKATIDNFGEKMVDIEKGVKQSLDTEIVKPLGQLVDRATELANVAKDKTVEGVKTIPIEIEKFAQNKVLQAQEQLGNVTNIAQEKAGNLLHGVQDKLGQIFTQPKVNSNVVDIDKGSNISLDVLHSLDVDIVKPLEQLVTVAKDKTVEIVKSVPVKIEELLQNKTLQREEKLEEKLEDVVHIVQEKTGNLVHGVEDKLGQIFAQPKVGGNLVDMDKVSKVSLDVLHSLDIEIVKPLEKLVDQATQLANVAKDKTVELVKSLPIHIQELVQNKTLEREEKLEKIFAQPKVGGKKTKKYRRSHKNRRTKSNK